jgi:hypothetical protein
MFTGSESEWRVPESAGCVPAMHHVRKRIHSRLVGRVGRLDDTWLQELHDITGIHDSNAIDSNQRRLPKGDASNTGGEYMVHVLIM